MGPGTVGRHNQSAAERGARELGLQGRVQPYGFTSRAIATPQRCLLALSGGDPTTSARRAKIINAEYEQQAARKFVAAARIPAPVPQAMQLRYLAMLFDIAGERSSVIVLPFSDRSGASLLGDGSAGQLKGRDGLGRDTSRPASKYIRQKGLNAPSRMLCGRGKLMAVGSVAGALSTTIP